MTRGQIVIESTDVEVTAKIRLLRAQEAELRAKLEAVRFSDRVEAIVTQTELNAIRTQRVREEHRATLLAVRSGDDGIFVMPAPADAPGRFTSAETCWVMCCPRGSDGRSRHGDSGRYRSGAQRCTPGQDCADRPTGSPDRRDVGARVSRRQGQLPSAALGSTGGGETMVDPRDDMGSRRSIRSSMTNMRLASPIPGGGFGGRAYVVSIWNGNRWASSFGAGRDNCCCRGLKSDEHDACPRPAVSTSARPA